MDISTVCGKRTLLARKTTQVYLKDLFMKNETTFYEQLITPVESRMMQDEGYYS